MVGGITGLLLLAKSNSQASFAPGVVHFLKKENGWYNSRIAKRRTVPSLVASIHWGFFSGKWDQHRDGSAAIEM